jgi:hypothetical protein
MVGDDERQLDAHLLRALADQHPARREG